MRGMQHSFVIVFMFLITLNTLMHNNTRLFYLILYCDDDKCKCVSCGCVSQSLHYGFGRGCKAIRVGSPVTEDHTASYCSVRRECAAGVLRCVALRCVRYQAIGFSTHSILLVHCVSTPCMHRSMKTPRDNTKNFSFHRSEYSNAVS